MSKSFKDFMRPVAIESARHSALHQKHVIGVTLIAITSWLFYRISEEVKNAKRFFSK